MYSVDRVLHKLLELEPLRDGKNQVVFPREVKMHPQVGALGKGLGKGVLEKGDIRSKGLVVRKDKPSLG